MKNFQSFEFYIKCDIVKQRDLLVFYIFLKKIVENLSLNNIFCF